MTYTGQLWTGIVVLLLYLAIVSFAAEYYIRRANLRWVEAHEAALEGRRAAGSGKEPGHFDAAIGIGSLLTPPTNARSGRGKGWHLDPLEWIGSQEIVRWVRLHEAQRLDIWQLPDHEVQARFARAMGQIEELDAVRQSAWRHRWAELPPIPAHDGHPDHGTVLTWRSELSQLLAELYNVRDATYNQLVSLYGKAGWVVFAAYLPVAALLASGYGPVLLAGFLGGLVSRMQRLVYAQGRPTAYGTTWVPLFLAPLLGALAAWAGLHLLALLQGLGVVSLESIIARGSDFRLAPTAAVFGLAVLFGFSERFINQIGDEAERVVAGGPAGESPAAAGNAPAGIPGLGSASVAALYQPPAANIGTTNGTTNGSGNRTRTARSTKG